MRLFAPFVAVALAVTLLSLPSPGPASAHGTCRNVYGGDVLFAHNMGCAAARRVVKTWGIRYSRDGIVNRPSRRFQCRGRNDSVEGLTVRCSRGLRWVRFYANAP